MTEIFDKPCRLNFVTLIVMIALLMSMLGASCQDALALQPAATRPIRHTAPAVGIAAMPGEVSMPSLLRSGSGSSPFLGPHFENPAALTAVGPRAQTQPGSPLLPLARHPLTTPAPAQLHGETPQAQEAARPTDADEKLPERRRRLRDIQRRVVIPLTENPALKTMTKNAAPSSAYLEAFEAGAAVFDNGRTPDESASPGGAGEGPKTLQSMPRAGGLAQAVFDQDGKPRNVIDVPAPSDRSLPSRASTSSLRRIPLRLKLMAALLAASQTVGIPTSGERYSQALAAVSSFLRGLETIRIGVDQAPGNGHQAASVNIMKRLRELGFQGRFEIIYAHMVKDKLEYLLPGFDPKGPDTQESRDRGWVAIKGHIFRDYASRARDSYPTVPLGIMVDASDPSRGTDWLKVRSLLTIEPFGWGYGSSVQVAGQAKSLSLPALTSIPFQYALPAPLDSARFVIENMSVAPKLQAKVPGLVRIIEAHGRIETLAAYGLGIGGVGKLTRLLRGAHYAQKSRPDLFKGGVVVPLISRLDEQEIAQLRAGIENDAALAGKVGVVSVDDPEIAERIRQLGKGEILVVCVGPVAQNVFDLLFSRSTLPPTVAGANGENLMYLTRNPFFNTVRFSHLNARLGNSRPEALDLIDKAHAALAKGPDSQESIGKFILASMEKDSPLSAAFRGGRSKNLDRDKVLESLLAAAVAMRFPLSWLSSPADYRPAPHKRRSSGALRGQQ